MERTPGTPTSVVRAGQRPDARTTGILLTILLSLALVAPGISVGAPRVDPGPETAVVVRTLAGSESVVGAEVARLGGTVTAQLGIIHGFAATMSRAALEALRSDPCVVSVSPDAPLAPASAGYDAGGDVNSMASTTDYSGASAWWRSGYTGAGVDVALIDTGVSPVEGLNGAGKVVVGPDLSIESQAS